MKIYLASGLDNAFTDEFKQLVSDIKALGHTITYEWWAHGSVRNESNAVIEQTAIQELRGVAEADLVIAYLPGGGGTHVEIGYALGLGIPVLLMNFDPSVNRKVCFYYLFGKVTWFESGQPFASAENELVHNIDRAMEKA